MHSNHPLGSRTETDTLPWSLHFIVNTDYQLITIIMSSGHDRTTHMGVAKAKHGEWKYLSPAQSWAFLLPAPTNTRSLVHRAGLPLGLALKGSNSTEQSRAPSILSPHSVPAPQCYMGSCTGAATVPSALPMDCPRPLFMEASTPPLCKSVQSPVHFFAIFHQRGENRLSQGGGEGTGLHTTILILSLSRSKASLTLL